MYIRKKKKEEKIPLSTQEIMDKIIDKTLLKSKNDKNIKKTDDGLIKIIKKEEDKKWWEKEMFKEDFSIIEYKGKFYCHHKDWSDSVYIGAYDNKDIIEDIIQDYIDNSKLPIEKRKLDTSKIHSVILKDIKDGKVRNNKEKR